MFTSERGRSEGNLGPASLLYSDINYIEYLAGPIEKKMIDDAIRRTDMSIPMKKVIKIAVVAGPNGEWSARGYSGWGKNDDMENAIEDLADDGVDVSRKYIVEAEIDVPGEITIEKIKGEVIKK
jgi:hypothetical protein